jgi:hypothetical protein
LGARLAPSHRKENYLLQKPTTVNVTIQGQTEVADCGDGGRHDEDELSKHSHAGIPLNEKFDAIILMKLPI